MDGNGEGGRERTVFVTVGTTSFDELVKAVDSPQCKAALFSKGYTNLLIQLGRGSYFPLKADPNIEFLACYLGELTLLDNKFLRYYPSLIAASIVYLAILILYPDEKNPWNPIMERFTGYKLQYMKDCVQDIHALHSSEKIRTKYDGAFKKFEEEEFNKIANLASVTALPPHLQSKHSNKYWKRRKSM